MEWIKIGAESETPLKEVLLPEEIEGMVYIAKKQRDDSALALKLDCSIFSGDKKLKRQSPVKVMSPRELLDLLTDSTQLVHRETELSRQS